MDSKGKDRDSKLAKERCPVRALEIGLSVFKGPFLGHVPYL